MIFLLLTLCICLVSMISSGIGTALFVFGSGTSMWYGVGPDNFVRKRKSLESGNWGDPLPGTDSVLSIYYK